MADSYYIVEKSSQTIELYFNKVPLLSIRQQLKLYHWHWNPNKICWYTILTQQAEDFAKQLGAVNATPISTSATSSLSPPVINKDILSSINITGFESLNIEQQKQILNKSYCITPKSISLSAESDSNEGIIIILLSLSGNIITLGIVENVSQQNSSQHIYWKNRSISKTVISSIINNKPWITYNDELCLICYYSDSSMFKRIRKHNHYFSNNDHLADIWIYAMKMPCVDHPKSIEAVTAFIPTTNSKVPCQINVQYCSRCDKYYINSKQYCDFARRYGLPFVRLMLASRNENTQTDYSTWREESLLHILGYNVSSKDNLTTRERHAILTHAIQTNTLTKPEIISFLEFLEYRNKNNLIFENACTKWREDVEFVRNYNINQQRKIAGTFKFNNSNNK